MKSYNIQPISKELNSALQNKIDHKTKPLGALGQLETIALKIGLIQNTLSPKLNKPHIVIFAGDHGIARDGVSAYPQEVTYQMVMNFVQGGAAINAFCRQNNIDITVVDAGVNHIFSTNLDIIHAKVGMGTKSFLHEPAMTREEVQQCLDKGSTIVNNIHQNGCNIIGFGEMGIGNTSSASALMSILCNIKIEECVGKGTGLDKVGLEKKIAIITQGIASNNISTVPLDLLASFGGFEIAQMCGAMLQAAEKQMIILVDGFISTAAFLTAYKINPTIIDYAIFCHQSDEKAHAKMLTYLDAKPLLNLHMRLGEGTGVAIAYPIIQASVNFLNEMASFESAGVSNKE